MSAHDSTNNWYTPRLILQILPVSIFFLLFLSDRQHGNHTRLNPNAGEYRPNVRWLTIFALFSNWPYKSFLTAVKKNFLSQIFMGKPIFPNFPLLYFFLQIRSNTEKNNFTETKIFFQPVFFLIFPNKYQPVFFTKTQINIYFSSAENTAGNLKINGSPQCYILRLGVFLVFGRYPVCYGTR